MNLGIYIDSLNNHDKLQHIEKLINDSTKDLDDASIFFNGIGPVPFVINCGIFNSTDLWNFHGSLVTTSLDNTFMACGIVNNIEIFYYYNWEEDKNTLKLIQLLNKNIKVICRNQEDEENLFRLTGKKSLGISDNFNNIVNIILENSDGRFKNRKNVCRSS
jgi:hypothetical protein